MLTYEEALDKLLAAASRLPSETIPVESAAGRILTSDATAPYPLPPFSNSQMDGYALRSADLTAATVDAPVRLPLASVSAAGDAPDQTLAPGAAARIMTGAPIPEGADAVMPQEDVVVDGDSVLFSAPAEPGQFVRLQGEDVASGQVVVLSGERIGPGEIAMLAATGHAQVAVSRRPRVAILATGDELAEPGRPLSPGQIYNSNAYALQAQVEEAGGEVIARRILRDDRADVRAALEEFSGADLILSSGGVSVGDRDFLKPTIQNLGELIFWGVGIRPGKPVAFGRVGRALYLGLPGNPVSSLVTFELFGRPLLLTLQGANKTFRRRVNVITGEDIAHDPGRRTYVRVRLESRDGALYASTTAKQGSHILRSVVAFDGLLILPSDKPGYAAGETATVLLIR